MFRSDIIRRANADGSDVDAAPRALLHSRPSTAGSARMNLGTCAGGTVSGFITIADAYKFLSI